MGYISILVGFFLIIFLIVKKWPAIIVGIIAATAVIALNRMPFGATLNDVYYTGFVNMMKAIFPCLFAGSFLAQVSSRTGAVNSISDALANALFKDGLSDTGRYISCFLAIVVTSGVLAYCGMNSLVTIIAIYPIALRLLERARIPKRFVMGMLSCGVYSFALSGPGTAQLVNVLGMQAMGTPSYAGLVAGIVGVIAEIVVSAILLVIMIKKDVAAGKVFKYGPKDVVISDDRALPNALVATIPLMVLVILFNVVSLDIFTSTMVAWLLAVVLFWKYIPKRENSVVRELLDVCTTAGVQAFGPVSMVGSLVGFSTIVQGLPEFQNILDAAFNSKLTPIIVLFISINIVCALTGSSTSGIRIGLQMVGDRCREAGLSAAFCHRFGAFACSVFDTMPYSSAMIINLGIADLDMKDGYPPMFMTTVVATLAGSVVCAIIMQLFPMLP